MSRQAYCVSIASLMAVGWAVGVSFAADATWTGNSSGNWATVGNWSPAVVPTTTGNNVFFNASGNQTITLAGDRTIGTLTFNATNPYLFNAGYTLTLGGNVTQNGAGTVTFNGPIATGGGARTWTGTGSGQVILNGVLSGGGLQTFAAGNYTLANTANTYTGNTVITGGIVSLTTTGANLQLPLKNNSNLGDANNTVTVNGGELRFNPASGYYNDMSKFDKVLSIGASGGILNFYQPTDTGTHTGSALNLNSNAADATPGIIKYAYMANYNYVDSNEGWSVAGRDLDITTFTTGTGALRFELTNGALLHISGTTLSAGGNLTFSGVPGGNASANSTSSNVGRVSVGTNSASDQTFTGTTMFFENAIQITGWQGNRTIQANLVVNSGTAAFAGISSGSGYNRVILGSDATKTLTISNNATAVFDVLYRTDAATKSTGGVTVNTPMVINAGGALQITQTVTPASGNNVSYIQINSNITGQGTDASGESLINLQVGSKSTDGGTIGGANFGVSSNLVVNGSGKNGLKVAGTAANLGNLLTAGRLSAVTGTGGYLTLAPTDATFNLPTGSMWADNDVGLKVVDSYSGEADVSFTNLTATWDRMILLETGATLDVHGKTISSTIQGTGSLVGGATLTGSIIPGTGNTTLQFGSGNLTLGSTAGVTLKLSGTNTNQMDRLAGIDTMSFGGTLNVTLNSYAPKKGDSFNVINFSKRADTTTFNAVNLPTLDAGLSWDTSALYTTGNLNVVPEPGTLALLAFGSLAVLRIRKRVSR